MARAWCRNCGVALDVGGGCGVCKPSKSPAIPGVGAVITEGMGRYKVLAHEGGTRLRVRSVAGVEISVDFANSGYRDQQRHGWREVA